MLLDAIAEDQGQETADTKSSDDEKNEDGIEDNKVFVASFSFYFIF